MIKLKMSSACSGWLLVAALIILVDSAPAQAAADGFRTAKIASGDGVMITVDLYMAHEKPGTPVIVLFHQAGWSRGEYREIAPRLNKLGYNCIAVDLRSGKSAQGVTNETNKRASKRGKGTTYVDALRDVRWALTFARKKYGESQIVAWGSSYSSALVLKVAGDSPQLVDAVMAFSPGEYFARFGKSKTWIRESAKKIQMPAFITSARDEQKNWRAIFDAIPSNKKVAFVPETRGQHGSRALWKKFSDSNAYWDAVSTFLEQHGSVQRR